MSVNTCCVVNQFCDSPANLYPPVHVKAKCFSCGDYVCTKCSSRRQYYHYGKVRLCDNCQEQYDGNDKIVKRRLLKMAGY